MTSDVCFVEAVLHEPCGHTVKSETVRVDGCISCRREGNNEHCEPVALERTSAAACWGCIEAQQRRDFQRNRAIDNLNLNIARGVGSTWCGGTRTGRATTIRERPRPDKDYCLVCLSNNPNVRCTGWPDCNGDYYCTRCWTEAHKGIGGHKVQML